MCRYIHALLKGDPIDLSAAELARTLEMIRVLDLAVAKGRLDRNLILFHWFVAPRGFVTFERGGLYLNEAYMSVACMADEIPPGLSSDDAWEVFQAELRLPADTHAAFPGAPEIMLQRGLLLSVHSVEKSPSERGLSRVVFDIVPYTPDEVGPAAVLSPDRKRYPRMWTGVPDRNITEAVDLVRVTPGDQPRLRVPKAAGC
ncbi:MAG: hypothetical protein ACYCW6_23725 [Candidatus Xenobia bacterium]